MGLVLDVHFESFDSWTSLILPFLLLYGAVSDWSLAVIMDIAILLATFQNKSVGKHLNHLFWPPSRHLSVYLDVCLSRLSVCLSRLSKLSRLSRLSRLPLVCQDCSFLCPVFLLPFISFQIMFWNTSYFSLSWMCPTNIAASALRRCLIIYFNFSDMPTSQNFFIGNFVFPEYLQEMPINKHFNRLNSFHQLCVSASIFPGHLVEWVWRDTR